MLGAADGEKALRLQRLRFKVVPALLAKLFATSSAFASKIPDRPHDIRHMPRVACRGVGLGKASAVIVVIAARRMRELVRERRAAQDVCPYAQVITCDA
jgi:hypothetical protein